MSAFWKVSLYGSLYAFLQFLAELFKNKHFQDEYLKYIFFTF